MADFNALETLINAYIKKNGVQAITGNILNGVLRGMVSALGKGYTIVGVATPSTDPGTLTGPCAYYASTYGTYTNFGNIVVNDGEIAMLIYDEQTWHKEKMWRLDAEASIDANVGTPSVETSFEDELLTFRFHNIKGEQGDAAGFGTVNATVDSNIGTPGVSVQTSGPDTAKNMTFQFTNLKGETGVTSVVCTVDNTIGTPSCAVSLVGQELHLDFSGLKGNKGDTGVSADYPITIYNGLDSTATDQALSAYQGKVLNDEISQLDLNVDGFDVPIAVLEDKTVSGAGIAKNNGQISTTGRADYSVKIYKIVIGKTYHIVIPKLSNAYTSAYGFLTDTQTVSPVNHNVTLPNPNVIGPIENYEANVTAPSDSLTNLVVCYETAYGVPTVTTQTHTDGLDDKVEALEDAVDGLEGDIEDIQESIVEIEGDVETLQEEVYNITHDTDETVYENEGQVEYYKNKK